MKNIKSITAIGRKWRDKINGNTYHSARVFVDGKLAACAGFQYGYGDQWVWSAAEALEKAGRMPGRKQSNGAPPEPFWRWCHDRDIELVLDCADVTKRECKDWGVPV